MPRYYSDCLGHLIRFVASVPNTEYTWDNSKCILWDDSLAINWERESEQFFLRAKLSGKITITGELAKAIMAMDKDDYAELTIQEMITETPGYQLSEDYTFAKTLKFRFSKADCSVKSAIDQIQPGTGGESYVTNYILEVTPEVVDNYTDILANLDTEFDLIKLLTPKTKFTYYRRPCLQIFTDQVDYLGNFLGGNYWETSMDSEDAKKSDRKFAKVFSLRAFRVTSDLPPSAGYGDMPGDYYMDMTNGGVPYGTITDYYIFKNGDKSTGKALHLTTCGTPSTGLFIGIKYAEQYILGDDDSWVDAYTIVTCSIAGYEYEIYGVPTDNWGTRTVEFNTASANVGLTMTDRIYYGRWYLPINYFDNRDVYTKPSDDPTASQDIVGYKYVCPATTTDVKIGFGVQNDTPGRWGKNDDDMYFHPPGGADTNNYIPLLVSSWDYQSIWLLRDSFNNDAEASGREPITIRDAYKINDVLGYLFNAANDPENAGLITNPYKIVWAQPYSQVAPETMLTPKSNIVRGIYDIAAQKAPITLGSVLDMLKGLYNLYWYVSADHTITIGTKQTLASNKYLDLAGIEPRTRRPWFFNQENAIEFENPELPYKQIIKWMDNSTEIFSEPTVINLGAMVDESEEDSIEMSNFTADIDYMVISGKECSNDGFALLLGQNFGKPGVVIYLGTSYTVSNAPLTLPGLLGYYEEDGLRQERPTLYYKYLYEDSDTKYRAWQLAYTVKQEVSMPIPLIDTEDNVSQSLLDLNNYEYKQLGTEYGSGRITKISVNLRSRMATITLEQQPK